MIFNSINYFFFLAITFVLYYLLADKFRWFLLLITSIVFYLIGSPIISFMVPVAIVLCTFFCGVLVEQATNPVRKKMVYLLGLFTNIGLLAFYKYINFFIQTTLESVELLKKLFGAKDATVHASLVLNILVPLGISYITFQAIGYLIEIHRGSYKAERNIGIFASYLMFFPKLFSGPIEPAQEFLPQVRQKHEFNYNQVVTGLKRILWGLFLKLVVANRLEIYTDAVFGNYTFHTGATLLVASFFFTIQIFADFAGYTDMAIGSAQIFGYKLMENFNTPFVAKSVTEFWRRWHISLSSWVNEYIYNPIVFSYRNWNKWGVVFAGMITFLILGFWHGPSWNFIFFGFLQGFILAVEFLSRKIRKRLRSKIPALLNDLLGIAFTFTYFTFSSIFFKANTLYDGFQILKRMFTIKGSIYYENPSIMIFSIIGILILLAFQIKEGYFNKNFSLFNNEKWFIRNLSYAILVIVILLIGVFDGGQFIYFKF